jgi:hypothetical protein
MADEKKIKIQQAISYSIIAMLAAYTGNYVGFVGAILSLIITLNSLAST